MLFAAAHGARHVQLAKATKISGRLCEQLGAALREPDEGPALVQHQPAALYRQIQPGLVFVRRAFLAEQERPVDQLDVDLTVLHGLDAVGDLQQLTSCLFGIGVRPVSGEFHTPSLSRECATKGRQKTNAAPQVRGPLCPLSTDIVSATRHVRNVPISDSRTAASRIIRRQLCCCSHEVALFCLSASDATQGRSATWQKCHQSPSGYGFSGEGLA